MKKLKHAFGFLHAKNLCFVSPSLDLSLPTYTKLHRLKSYIDMNCSESNPMIFFMQQNSPDSLRSNPGRE